MNSRKGEHLAVGDATMPFTASRETLSRLFCEHHRRILTTAYRITGSMADAEDVTQAVFMRLASSGGLPATNAGSYLYRAGWLRLAISELPLRAAEMFSLRYVEELGNREIATLMGTSQAVVAVTLHHARSKLKKRLREMEQERP